LGYCCWERITLNGKQGKAGNTDTERGKEIVIEVEREREREQTKANTFSAPVGYATLFVIAAVWILSKTHLQIQSLSKGNCLSSHHCAFHGCKAAGWYRRWTTKSRLLAMKRTVL